MLFVPALIAAFASSAAAMTAVAIGTGKFVEFLSGKRDE